MSQFRFRSSDGRDIAPQEWLRVWAELYPEKDYDNAEYGELIAKHKNFATDDFVRIGKRFLSIHAAVYNVFNIQRHLTSRRTLRVFRDQAMLTWRQATVAA